MSIELFYDLGYSDLMPVIPPGAEISPHSRISPAAVGKIPGVLTRHGWVGHDLTKRVYLDLGQAESYEAAGANFGLAADRFPAIDVDVDDPSLTHRILPTLFKHLGEGPVRTSKPGRALVIYRSAEPLPRVTMKLSRGGQSHMVELLGRDRQYVVQGEHPSGASYGFVPSHDLCDVGDLAFITLDQVTDLFGKMKEALEGEGWDVEIHQEGDRVEREIVDQEELKAPSPRALAEAVKEIPNTYDDRADWIRVGHAIKAASQDFLPTGYQIWEWWSNQWEGGNDPVEIERNWDRMRSPFELGYPYLLSLAGGGGALAQEMFSPDPDADEEPPAPVGFSSSDAPAYTDRWALDQIQSQIGDHLIFNPQRGAWMVWDGHRWAEDEGDRSLDIMGDLLQEMAWNLIRQGEAAGKEGKPMIAAAKKYQNVGGLKAVKQLAESRLGISNDAFDADHMKLNTPAGVVDLRSGEVSPPSPEVLVSRSTTVAPAGSYSRGDAPLWEAFIRDLSGGDPEMVDFYHRLCGYCLTGETSEKALFYIWGANSDTGKSTFIRIIQELMAGYSDTVGIDSVIGGSSSGKIPTDLAKIAGARLVTATEPGTNQSWNEERVKAMTGGDLITARFLYQDEFSYYPTYKILIVGNHEPDLTNVDDSMLRRIRIIPANHKVPPQKQIPNLSARVVDEEGAAVLRWMIDGARLWYREGLTIPAAVQEATDSYIEDENILDQFVEEKCYTDENAFVSRNRLYKEWRRFCRAKGEDPGSEKGFKRTFGPKAAELDLRSQRGQDKGDDHYRRGYRGIGLKDEKTTTKFRPGG